MIAAMLTAFGLAFVNAIAAVVVILVSEKKNVEDSSRVAMISMVVRFALSAFAIWAVLALTNLNQTAFSVTFVISVFVLIIAEIIFIDRRAKRKKRKTLDNKG